MRAVNLDAFQVEFTEDNEVNGYYDLISSG